MFTILFAINKSMYEELAIYNCDEYFDEYYLNGLFHPAEAYNLYPHKGIIKDEVNGYLEIGAIWDDNDARVCFRKSMKGVWARGNYDGEFHLLYDTLKEFVEGWYQWTSDYWNSMTSEFQWESISKYYMINIERYNWNSQELLDFVNEGIEHQLSNQFYIKAYKNCFSISSTNGFMRRPNNNMVEVYYETVKEEYRIYFKESFFKEHSSETYEKDEIENAIKSITKWINKCV